MSLPAIHRDAVLSTHSSCGREEWEGGRGMKEEKRREKEEGEEGREKEEGEGEKEEGGGRDSVSAKV